MHLRNNQIRFTKRLYKPIIDSNIKNKFAFEYFSRFLFAKATGH
jgi:hypothetical protein